MSSGVIAPPIAPLSRPIAPLSRPGALFVILLSYPVFSARRRAGSSRPYRAPYRAPSRPHRGSREARVVLSDSLPTCPRASARRYQSSVPQNFQRPSQPAIVDGRRTQTRAKLPASQPVLGPCQQRENRGLQGGRRDIALRPRRGPWRTEPDGHAPAAVFDLRRRKAGGGRQRGHLQRPPPPLLDDAAPVEGARDQGFHGSDSWGANSFSGVRPKCSTPDDVTSRRSSYTATPTEPPPIA